MSGAEITAAVTAAANVMAEKLNANELAFLGAVFTQLADTLLTIAASMELCDNNNEQ
ncbi:MAG: hypothetical protein LIO69_02480 [Oscillospiraceae bacterium]|nr:hypothetical protein [Oscillospiraceae bacterium]